MDGEGRGRCKGEVRGVLPHILCTVSCMPEELESYNKFCTHRSNSVVEFLATVHTLSKLDRAAIRRVLK